MRHFSPSSVYELKSISIFICSSFFFSLFQGAYYYRRKQNPRKGTLDRFNWLEIMRLLIYYQTLISWKPFKAANILYHLFSPCLSFAPCKQANLQLRIFSSLCNFIDSCRHFYAASSFISISQYVSQQYQYIASCVAEMFWKKDGCIPEELLFRIDCQDFLDNQLLFPWLRVWSIEIFFKADLYKNKKA